MSAHTLLLTGFGPFDRHPVNASAQVLEIDAWPVREHWQVRTCILPVSWARAWPMLESELDASVRGVLALGQADIDGLQLERHARNHNGSRVDADGDPPGAQQIVPEGPGTRATRLPLARLQRGLEAGGHPVTVADDAGDFLCNHVFYRLMDHVAHHRADLQAGFVHVPEPGRMAGEDLRAAVLVLVSGMLEHLEIRDSAMGRLQPMR
jgi:pyroglutamyl-peptidase